MSTFDTVFRSLYTGFLLRDLCGKLVPGAVLLFSISLLFRHPSESLRLLSKETPLACWLLVAGLTWTIALGVQSFAEGVGIWGYFPAQSSVNTDGCPPIGGSNSGAVGGLRAFFSGGDESDFDYKTMCVDEYQAKASEDEKQQYERFVAIKEACGNLFAFALFSVPAWLFRWWADRAETNNVRRYATTGKYMLIAAYGFGILVGLHRMHEQHVHRQFSFAANLVRKHKQQPSPAPAVLHLDLEQKK